jgi:hypothetical protein
MSDDVWGDFIASGGADTYCQNNSNTGTQYKIYYNTHSNAGLYQPQVNLSGYDGTNDYSKTFTTVVTNNSNSSGCGESARLLNPLTVGNPNLQSSQQESTRQFTSNNTNASSTINGWHQAYDPEVVMSPRKLILLESSTTSNSRLIEGNNEGSFASVDSLFDVFKQTQSISDLNNAKSINLSINADNNIEQNQKDFNGIYAIYLEGDSATLAGKISELQNMAVLCPFADGLAVYQARSLLRYWDDSTTYYNSCENPVPNLTQNSSRKLDQSLTNSSGISLLNLYPNPSNGQLILKGTSKNSNFELYDVVGRKVFSGSLNENETQLDLNSLNNGTYIFKILKDGKEVKRDKLIINK